MSCFCGSAPSRMRYSKAFLIIFKRCNFCLQLAGATYLGRDMCAIYMRKLFIGVTVVPML